MEFTHFIAVDWSSRNQPSPAKPTKDAIWVAEGAAAGAEGGVEDRYFRTRSACIDYLERRLLELARAGERVFVGWDFCFGYPLGLSTALGVGEGPDAWRKVWTLLNELIEDGNDNSNNRFAVAAELNRRIGAPAGPFWGVARGKATERLIAKRGFTFPLELPTRTLENYRATERGQRGIQAAWKLYGPGSVGSQVLMGIPRLHYLRFNHEELSAVSRVWPFENIANARVAHVEIWPSMIERPREDEIADREQVRTYVAWLRQLQHSGELPSYFQLPPRTRDRARTHEGWVFGVRE